MENLTYQIVSDDYIEDLSRNISKLLSQGWQLYGTPYTTDSYRHNQALIKPQNPYKDLQNEAN